jgi:hypothetical protein
MTEFTDRDMLAWHLEVASGIVGHYGITDADADMIEPYGGYAHEFSRFIDEDSARIAVSPLGALILAEHPIDIGYELPAGWYRKSLKHWSKLPAVAAFAQYLVAEHEAAPGPNHADTINEWRRHPATTEAVVVKTLKSASVAVEGGTFTPDSLPVAPGSLATTANHG